MYVIHSLIFRTTSASNLEASLETGCFRHVFPFELSFGATDTAIPTWLFPDGEVQGEIGGQATSWKSSILPPQTFQ